jgi:hypothetical protein
MNVEVIEEAGYESALRGLALNKFQPVDNMPRVAGKLAPMGNGHNKFLRQMKVWVEIQATIAWWAEFDTYKVGVVRQSSSTMHKPEGHFDYSDRVLPETKEAHTRAFQMYLEGDIDIATLKDNIPCGLLMTSVVSMNYENIRNIVKQRKNHRYRDWGVFCASIFRQLGHPEFLEDLF